MCEIFKFFIKIETHQMITVHGFAPYISGWLTDDSNQALTLCPICSMGKASTGFVLRFSIINENLSNYANIICGASS
jgi:hypothetical protein